MLTLGLIAGALAVLVVATIYRSQGPCEGPNCSNRGWWHYDDGRTMCGDCCWLADQDCLDLDAPHADRR